MTSVFLTGQWRRLVMLNFPIEPKMLHRLTPRGTEIDAFEGITYISLVAFSFLDAKVMGLALPLHRNFEEINLRFYVCSRGPDGWRRGVVFVREVVPRWSIAFVARWLYNEKYQSHPTRSRLMDPTEDSEGSAEYSWKHQGEWPTEVVAQSSSPAAKRR